MIKLAEGWDDYRILATGGGFKLERWGKLVLLRPDPQVIWAPRYDLEGHEGINAVYRRSNTGGGAWQFKGGVPGEFEIGRRGLRFSLKLRQISVLNLFGYTGGATVACAAAGAKVTHVDAAKAMVERCKTNAALSGVPDTSIRYIVDDCGKFVARELRRGHRYDAIVMDPPSYGRGSSGEVWKIEDMLFPFVEQCVKLLSDDPLFVLINSYTTGLQPTVIENILRLTLDGRGGTFESYEVGLPTDEGIALPCGCSGIWRNIRG